MSNSINDIDRLCSSIEQDFKAHKKFNSEQVNHEIVKNLQDLQNFIVNESEKCLIHLTEWNQGLCKMDNDISEVSGLLERVKADAGSRLLAEVICQGGASQSQNVTFNYQTGLSLRYPNYPFVLNTSLLQQVGREAADVKEGIDVKSLPSLIKKIPPGQAEPIFWSKTPDFFYPELQSIPTATKEQLTTSFSEFYKFDPMSALRNEQ